MIPFATGISQPKVEKIINGVFLCQDSYSWTDELLRGKYTHIIYIDRPQYDPKATIVDQNEFECLELRFFENAQPTSVLPNIYKSVKFISKALDNEGRLLILDSQHQKCITVIIGYLMYNFELNFM